MHLIDLSAQRFTPGRKKRNEACYLHLLETGAFAAGVFVDAMTVTPRAGPLHLSVQSAHASPVRDTPSIVLRSHLVGTPETGAARALARLVATEVRNRLAGEDYVLWANHVDHFAHALFELLAEDARVRVLDLSDDFSTWRWREGAAFYRARIAEMAARCDKLLCINEHVAQRFPHRDALVFPNGTDFEHFQRARTDIVLPPLLPKTPGTPVVGFIGGLVAERIDVTLLRALLRRFPRWRFVFCGYANDPSLLRLLQVHRNALFVPELPYDVLPAVIRSFDVAIVPHVVDDFTAGNDLLKIHDYFACGIPVVTTPCSNVTKFAEALSIATTPEDFCTKVEAAVERADDHDPTPGLEIARRFSWPERIHALLPWLHQTS